MSISREQVKHVANLARLDISDEEVDRYGDQLNRILQAIEELRSVDTTEVEPTAHVMSLRNVLREDQTGDCLDRETVLREAPDRDGPYFRVPKVVSGGDES